ncbi:protein BREAKING OF ASYMMETRY IN THE STOMATAL LINEAGE [Benincasa hispida]|uniref:protein BREAKING OF ASYMMETRY IN THE STOMATAL LINEAGE n=1 Tax=Benincasa hispida TaxID=102211 RepID=UPI001902015D|nr:protein BREAKING OF ASYMMETRY IN THE STOMATAL LINEAGE [Benincasa hispida]
MPITNIVFDTKSSTSRGRENTKKMSRQRKRSSPQAKDVLVKNKMVTRTTDDSSWPQFEDEDYIVFCFKEDGAFDVIKNGNNSETSSHCIDLVSTSSRPLNYSEDDKAAKRYNNGGHIRSGQKEDEEEEIENIYKDKEENRMANHIDVINDNPIEEVPTESSDSNHSDVSNGSFAFPVLGWEWSGSPVQMPKSKGLRLRKHKARCAGFQYCCKF